MTIPESSFFLLDRKNSILQKFWLIPVLCLISFRSFGQNDALKDSIDLYSKQFQWQKVIPISEKWVEKCKKERGEESVEYGVALNTLGDAMVRVGITKEVEPILLKGLEIKKRNLGDFAPEVANSYHSLGLHYLNLKLYDQSISSNLQALEIRKKALGAKPLDLWKSYQNLGGLYEVTGQKNKADSCLRLAMGIKKNIFGPTSKEGTESVQRLGWFYLKTNQFKKAEDLYESHLQELKKDSTTDQIRLASFLDVLGDYYQEITLFGISNQFFLEALDLKKKAMHSNDPQLAISFRKIGQNSAKMGDFTNAQRLITKSLEIRKASNKEMDFEYALDLLTLGQAEDKLGNFKIARSVLKQALAIAIKYLPENDLRLTMFYSGMAENDLLLNDFSNSNLYALKSLEILQKGLEPSSPYIGHQAFMLSIINYKFDNYYKGDFYLKKSLELLLPSYGILKYEYGASKINLGNSLGLRHNYPAAEKELMEGLQIMESSNSPDFPARSFAYNSIGALFFKQGNLTKAEFNFKKSAELHLKRITNQFTGLSTIEQSNFLQNIQPQLDIFKSFSIERFGSNPFISGSFYDHQLNTKSLLLSSSAKWKHRIKNSGDKKLFLLFTEWEAKQNRLAKLYQSTDSTERAGIDSLLTQTEKMEKELSLRSENFSKLADRRIITWKDVQKTLKLGEVAIEMIRVQKFGIEKTVTDTSDPKKPTYKINGLTDTIQYAALIVKPTSKYPEMVLLKNGNELEGKYLHFYNNNIKFQHSDAQSYNQFWKKVGDQLKEVKTIYFSPDGVYNSINLNTLRNPKTGKYLLEEKDIRLVTVTKDLVTPKQEEEPNKLACLVGYPNYYKKKQEISVAAKTTRSSPQLDYDLNLESSKTLVELPATKIEVEKIGYILSGKGWEVLTYTEDKALEENIKDSYKPKVLHVATHGYFHADSSKGKNPLLNSGLMLTGGGSTLKGEKSETAEDGILTAYEAMNLNLDNTDLVVLSACETGLGEIKNGEGVYGLQRAFKVAGAKTIIMSLWEVEDGPTQELMVSFYKHWLGNAVGASGQTATITKAVRPSVLTTTNSKRSAFLKAQKELKAKYPEPFYWGAFVMVGE